MIAQTRIDYAQTFGLSSVRIGNVTLYPESHELFIGESYVPCALTSFYLLELLLSNICKTIPRERLLGLRRIPLSSRELNRLRVQMFNLKRLLRIHGAQLEIRTVRRFGYQARPLNGQSILELSGPLE